MTKARIIFQEAIKLICLMMFYFIWFRYFVRKHLLALLLSALLSTISYLIMFFISKKMKKKSGLLIKEKEEAQNMFLSLAFMHNQGQFLEKLGRKLGEKVTKRTHHVVVDSKTRFAIYFEENLSGLSAQKLFEIRRSLAKENLEKIIILCREISDKQVYLFSQSFKEKIIILNQFETYQKIYKQLDIYPQITTSTPKEKKFELKDFIAYSFNKKRTKGYLFSALVLILSSLFVRATLYYCIVSSLLFVFALISYFNPKFNQKEKVI